MEHSSNFFDRKRTRLKNFDYSSCRYYFVTICCCEKKCLFGSSKMLNSMGCIAKEEMESLPSHYSGVTIDSYAIMPNHVHAIIAVKNGSMTSTTLSSIVGSYKSGVSRKIRKIQPELTVWQRSFHDHVIRNQIDYEKIWTYVTYNPSKWEEDCFYQPNLIS